MIKIGDELLTGVESIDNQHRDIIHRVNRLVTICESSPCLQQMENEAKSILDFLTGYVTTHFKDEEALQIECGYPEYEAHKKEHEMFIKNFFILRVDFMKKGVVDESLLHSINNTVVEWLIVHIGNSDIRFARYYHQFKSLLPRAPKIIR